MRIANHEQARHWNSDEAGHWVTRQDAYDRMLAPFTAMLLDTAALRPGDRVPDVGCGCGGTTLAAARAVAPASPRQDAVRSGVDHPADSDVVYRQWPKRGTLGWT